MISTHVKCSFCGGNHTSRQCNVEKQTAPIIKEFIGYKMEHFIENNVKCPNCKKGKLNVLGNNSPSLDCICNCCKYKYEIKSKCLSVNTIPDNIYLKHGNYEMYKNRQNSGLDFIIIIYGVNRYKKSITIKKVFHVPHNDIINNNNFKVEQQNNHCVIKINNHTKYNCYKFNRNISYDFSKIINQFIYNVL